MNDLKQLFRSADEPSRRDFVSHAAKACLGVGFVASGGVASNAIAAAGTKAYKGGGTAKNVIYLYMGGGMSHLDTFDPKPGAKTQGPVEAIKTKSGVMVSEHFPKTANQIDNVCIVSGLSSKTGAHAQANYFTHTSYPMRGTIKHPHLGAYGARLLGKHNRNLPSYVKIGRGDTLGGGFLEAKYAALPIGDPEAGLQYTKRPAGVTEEQYDKRLSRARMLNQRFVSSYDQKQVRAYSDLYDEAIRLMKSQDLEAFDLKQAPDKVRNAYGRNSFGQGVLLARRLVEQGVRFVEVNYGGWDTHSNNFDTLKEKGKVLDDALGELLADLERRGLLESTMVVVATEFGRTPDIVTARMGRNHYPVAFSFALAGGGVKGGQRYGKTDPEGRTVIENGIGVPDFNATIAYAMGLPLEQIIHSPSRRPFTVAHKGKPVTSIF